MAVLLGGRAAESLHFAEVTTGASDDLVKATEIARSMVTRYGMSEKLGQIAYESTRNVFLAQTGEIPVSYTHLCHAADGLVPALDAGMDSMAGQIPTRRGNFPV